MSQPQTICILEIFKDFFGCKNVLVATHQSSQNFQRLFLLQNCLSRKSAISWKYSKIFSPAKLSQPQIIYILEIFKDFFACKLVLAANHRYPGNIQRFFRLQSCLSRKPSISWKYSKTFSPAKMSQPQTICILEIFKDFFGCKNVLVATHQSSQSFQRLFLLQICLSRKSAISWKHSKIFSPAKFSQPQISDILETFKDFSACKNVLAANHLYPGIFQRLFRLQNCLRKSAIYWKHSKSFPPSKLSQQQPINILKSFKDFFACKIVLAANHRYPGNIQRFFRLQSCLSRKSSISWKYSKISSPANLSQPQIIDILEIFKDFFACKNVLAANHLYPGNIQRLFRLQKCLSSNPSKFSKFSKTLPPAKLSQPQISDILETFEDFFACKIFVAANQRYPGNIQRFFRLQKCLSRKSSISWKNSKTFSPAHLSSPQIIDILEIYKDLFACKKFLASTHHYSEKIQRPFRLQNCLSRKSSISWKYSKIFSAAKLSQPQIIYILEIFKDFFACKLVLAANHRYPGNIQRLFRLQKCLSRKPSVSWKYSKTFSAAKMSQQQPIKVLKIFKDSSACKIVLAANQRYPGNIQRFFRLQKCLSRKPSVSWKYSKTFSAAKMSQQQPIKVLKIFNDSSSCKIVLAANQRYPGNIRRFFRLQNFRSRKSAISWKHSKIFPPAKMSQPQTICILEFFKDFFACKVVLAANHLYPGNIQRFLRLQTCLSRKSSISWKYSKTFSPAKMSQPQTICILEIFKDFFGCKNVLVATHQSSQNFQRLFRLQNCLSRKSAISWKYSKIFSPAKMSQPQTICILEIFKDFFGCKNVLVATHQSSQNFQRLFLLQNCLSRKSAISWKHSKIFSPAKFSQPQISDILETFKDFSACKNVLAANHLYPGIFQRLFRLQNCLSRKSAIYWKHSKSFPP